MSAYNVTFIADHFVLNTTVNVSDEELVIENPRGSLDEAVKMEKIIEQKAFDFLQDLYGFSPLLEYAHEVLVEAVYYDNL